MQNYKTISDINNLMGRIGCFNKAQLDNQLHQSYINEGIENEDWHPVSHNGDDVRNGLRSKDHNEQIVITPSYSILYNCSKSKDIPSIIENGPNWEYCNAHAFGKGVYTNFQEWQAHESTWARKFYGDTVVKYRYNGDLMKECLVLEPQLWKLSGSLREQAQRFKGFEEFLRRNGSSIEDLEATAKGGGKGSYSADASQKIIIATDNEFPKSKGDAIYHKSGEFYGAHCDDVLMKYGIQGIIHYGHTDGPVAVIYNSHKLQALEYCTIRNTTQHRANGHNLEWIKIPEGKGVNTNLTDTRAFTHFFADKFEGNPLYLRPRCGEMLMKDKKTGKWTFIDIAKAEEAIYKGVSQDVRLFGDFEFVNALNFSNESGRELACVQLDNDRTSRFYIDKNGNLYQDENSKQPISNIKTYYANENEPLNNDIFDDDDSDVEDMEGLKNFEKMFGFGILESIRKIVKQKINETLYNEDRVETNDGHIELDNFDFARSLMKFNGPDDVYFITIAERHKDHPDRHYDHDACAYKGFFEVTSIEHLNRIEPVIKNLCRKGEWRAMMYLNPRPMADTRDYAYNVLEPRFKRHNSHKQGHEIEVAYGQSKDWNNRPICFVDVDNDDPKIHQQVLDYINKMGLTPLNTYKTTNNGLHIILPNKEEAKKLDFSFLDKGKQLGKWATAGLEIDKSFTLYAYVKAQGYGTQKRMQQKLGGK